MNGICPVCDEPHHLWLILKWGIIWEIVCLRCASWTLREFEQHGRTLA